MAHSALAQDQDAAEGRIIEELVVTAQKREQSILDVPLAVSALSGERLRDLQITEFDQLSDFIPGLVVQEQSPNNPGFVIRGITSDDGSAQISPRVTIYENGVDVSRSRGSQFELFDLDRVEVVKGPQATLFGTASLIGAVSVHTARPEQEFGFGVEASYGNFDAILARGFVTGGNDFIQGRLATSYRRRDGFVENIAGDPGSQTVGTPQDDLNGLEIFAIRPSIRLTPNDKLLVDFVLNYQQESPPGTAFKSGIIPPTGGATDPFSFAELGGSPFSAEVLGDDDLGLDRRRYSAILDVSYDLNDALTFSSISGYLNFDSLEVFDADGSPAFYLEFAEDAVGEVISQEFRLDYTGNRFTGFAGFNYYHEEGSQTVPFSTDETILAACLAPTATPTIAQGFDVAPTCVADGLVQRLNLASFVDPTQPTFVPAGATAGIPGAVVPFALSTTNTGNFDTFSWFIDGTYRVTDRFEVTGGVRVIYEDREFGFAATNPDSDTDPSNDPVILPGLLAGFGLDTAGVTVTDSEDFLAVLPRINLLYQVTDSINTYISIGRGRRSPILDVDAALDPVSGAVVADSSLDFDGNFIADEIVWNYEIGAKGRFFDGAVNADVTFFYQEYQDFQTTIVDPSGIPTPVSVGSATNFGIEAAFDWQVTPLFTVFGNFAYLQGGFDDDPSNGFFAGNQFRLQPEFTAAAGGLYEQEILSRYRVFGSVSWSLRTDVFFTDDNLPQAGLAIAESDVNLINIRGGFGSADGRWEISGFATNLGNESFIIDAGNTGGFFGTPTFIAGQPRFFGIELKLQY